MQLNPNKAVPTPTPQQMLAGLVRRASVELREFEALNPTVTGRALRKARREIALKYYRVGKALRKELSRGHSATADVAPQPAATLPSADVATTAATPERDVAKDSET